jgi:hypothetical protein
MADVQNAPNDDNPLVRIFASDGLEGVARRIGSSLGLRDQGRLGMAMGQAGEQYRIGTKRNYAAEKIQSFMRTPMVYDADLDPKPLSHQMSFLTRQPSGRPVNRTSIRYKHLKGWLKDDIDSGRLEDRLKRPIDRGR